MGGGPVGVLTALHLAKRGFLVDVYEKGADPAGLEGAAPRSYPLLLSARGVAALEGVGAQELVANTPQQGTYDVLKGALQAAGGKGPEDQTYIVDRDALVGGLTRLAQEQYPMRVRFHYQAEVQEVDTQKRVVTVASPAGAREVPYDLLVGADGAGSGVRQVLEDEGILSSVTPIEIKRGYKTFGRLTIGEDTTDIVPGFKSHLPRQYMYMYGGLSPLRLMMWKDEGGNMVGMISGSISYERQCLKDRLSNDFPSLPASWQEGILDQVVGDEVQPLTPFGSLIRVTQYHGPRIVLLGDAAHAVTNSLGQEGNVALESIKVFSDSLASCGDDLDKVPAKFTEMRKYDVDCLQNLEELQVMLSTPVKYGDFLLQLYAKLLILGSTLCSSILHTIFPQQFRSPVYLFAALKDARVSYSAVYDNMRLQSILVLLGATLITVVLVRFAEVAAMAVRRVLGY